MSPAAPSWLRLLRRLRPRRWQLWAVLGVAAYGAVLIGTEVLVRVLPRDGDALVAEASTNLENLSAGRLDTLLTSAALTGGAAPGYLIWVLGLLLVSALVLGLRRELLAFAVAHVGATVLTALLLAWDALPGVDADAARSISDVGPSYGTVGVVTAAAVLGFRGRWMGPLAGVLVLALMGALVPGAPDVATWGHLCSAALVLPLALWMRATGWGAARAQRDPETEAVRGDAAAIR